MFGLRCPQCGEDHPSKIWSDVVSWGCTSCWFYEDEYKGPSLPAPRFGISNVERDVNLPLITSSPSTG